MEHFPCKLEQVSTGWGTYNTFYTFQKIPMLILYFNLDFDSFENTGI